MSGHSKWANIKNRKGAADKKRSEVFTKLARGIIGAIKLGGGVTNPEANSYLKVALEKAREANMPKENVERLLNGYKNRQQNLVSMVIEAYGPGGIPIMVKAETDNKNRTLGEMRLIFKNYGGAVGEEGSVRFQFAEAGFVEYEGQLSEEEQLELMELGMTDWNNGEIEFEKGDNGVKFKDYLEQRGKKVSRMGKKFKYLGVKPVIDEERQEELLDLIGELENMDEVESVNWSGAYEQES